MDGLWRAWRAGEACGGPGGHGPEITHYHALEADFEACQRHQSLGAQPDVLEFGFTSRRLD